MSKTAVRQRAVSALMALGKKKRKTSWTAILQAESTCENADSV
jgi:hypothetical protein